MADVDTTQIEQAVTDIVNDAHKDGSIDELTPRMIRSRAEERLGLEGGTLDAWKDVVKRAATRAIDALDEDAASSATASDEEVKPTKSAPKSKPKQKAASSSAKRKSTKKEDEGTPPSKKPRTSSTTKKEKATAKKVKEEAGRKNGKVVRSASVIPSSDDDEEEDEQRESPAISSSPGKGKATTKGKERAKRPPLPKNTSINDADVSTAEVGDGDGGDGGDGDEAETSARAKPASKQGKGKSELGEVVVGEEGSVTADDESVTAEGEGGKGAGGPGEEGKEEAGAGGEEGKEQAGERAEEKSESEMSVLIDEEPAKKRRGKKGEPKSKSKASKEKASAKGKGKLKAKKDAGEEDAEDGEIKRLKSFITACGVRKLWSREFASHGISISSPPTHADKLAQIRHLKGMLKELGMEGRLSMEKARRVRERRELDRELEDVQTFEKAVVHGTSTSTRSSRSSHPKTGAATSGGNESDVDEPESDHSELELESKPKRKVNARQSIMAFLGDQSESE